MEQTDMVQQAAPSEEWVTGLFSCFEDMNYCCYGFWCCPCMACLISEKLGECKCLPLLDIILPVLSHSVVALLKLFLPISQPLVPMCISPAGLSLRVAMRHKYGIKGTLSEDIVISCFCDWCSWCQMARELKHRHSSLLVVNVQPEVVNMQPTPTVTTQTNLVNQSFGGSGHGPPPHSGPYGYQPHTGPPATASAPEYGPQPASAPGYCDVLSSGPATASGPGHGPPPPSGPYGYQPPTGPPGTASGPGYGPPPPSGPYGYQHPTGPATASGPGYGALSPSGPYGNQHPTGPATASGPGYGPPPYDDLAGPMIPHKY